MIKQDTCRLGVKYIVIKLSYSLFFNAVYQEYVRTLKKLKGHNIKYICLKSKLQIRKCVF
jgi:hypothetical protein